MGVPAFFRWLCMRNPNIVIDAIDQQDSDDIQTSENPEIDNLYLDMNGIIHPCCHPQNNTFPTPLSLQEMFNNIFLYVDKLMNIVRPQKLLYMAIDGVAPRAKMNQQRSRRFRASQEAQKIQQEKENLRQHWLEQGKSDPRIDMFIENHFDSNTITPGTPFMYDLSIALQYYICERMNSHPLWQGLIVIFSDANVPGEGEHKILEYIRLQRAHEGYNPNTKHCLYGADADLIMLGLSTHDPYFYIIRETFLAANEKMCTICGKNGHFFMDCPIGNNLDGHNNKNVDDAQLDLVKQDSSYTVKSQDAREVSIHFQFAKLYVMRQYIDYEFKNLNLPFQYDLENIIDDFIFMCFFCGNDFLPHIPILSIREGGIDALMFLYKKCLPYLGGYMTNSGELNLTRVDIFLRSIGDVEEAMIKDQKDRQDYFKRIDEQKKQQQKHGIVQQQGEQLKSDQTESIVDLYDEFKKQMKDLQQEISLVKEKDEDEDKIGINYKQQYYNDKLGIIQRDFIQFQHLVRQHYTEALCWNLAYYYKGCISWNWYYPYHYSPYATDLKNIDFANITFNLGEPFSPFSQLLAVLPAQSASALPKCYKELMSNDDSDIIDFYPKDFFVDLKGKKYAWLGEVILPFIEEDRLLNAAKKCEAQLTPEEKYRNRKGNNKIFLNYQKYHELIKQIVEYQNSQGALDEHDKQSIEVQNFVSNQLLFQLSQTEHPIAGFAQKINNEEDQFNFQLNQKLSPPDNKLELQDISDNQIISFKYVNPPYIQHESKLKQGIDEPQCEIDDYYMEKIDRKSYCGEKAVKFLERLLGKQQQTRIQQNRFKQFYNYKQNTQQTNDHMQQEAQQYQQQYDQQQTYRSHQSQRNYHQQQQQQYNSQQQQTDKSNQGAQAYNQFFNNQDNNQQQISNNHRPKNNPNYNIFEQIPQDNRYQRNNHEQQQQKYQNYVNYQQQYYNRQNNPMGNLLYVQQQNEGKYLPQNQSQGKIYDPLQQNQQSNSQIQIQSQPYFVQQHGTQYQANNQQQNQDESIKSQKRKYLEDDDDQKEIQTLEQQSTQNKKSKK